MHQDLVALLQCPVSKADLKLEQAVINKKGHIESGLLVSQGNPRFSYPIVGGVAKFIPTSGVSQPATVRAFGDQWNFFNFKFADNFKLSMQNTFGTINWVAGKTVVDAGAGSGMQSRWLAESGAKRVIALELSHTVDGIMQDNLKHTDNVDIIQCSIDNIPLKDAAIEGLVLCHNVIQHTASVEKTLTELWRITGNKSEMAFNCYTYNDATLGRRLRYKFYRGVRFGVSALPMFGRLVYSHLMSLLALVPGLGWVLERADLMRRGPVLANPGWSWVAAAYQAGVINTYDYFGAHQYQHHHTYAELKAMVKALKPAAAMVNEAEFFVPMPASGIALRVKK